MLVQFQIYLIASEIYEVIETLLLKAPETVAKSDVQQDCPKLFRKVWVWRGSRPTTCFVCEIANLFSVTKEALEQNTRPYDEMIELYNNLVGLLKDSLKLKKFAGKALMIKKKRREVSSTLDSSTIVNPPSSSQHQLATPSIKHTS